MPQKHDRTVEAIFNQLDLLSEMATSAGEVDLAKDLKSLFEKALSRYCNQKRERLAAQIANVEQHLSGDVSDGPAHSPFDGPISDAIRSLRRGDATLPLAQS